jgi:hypothetical protein
MMNWTTDEPKSKGRYFVKLEDGASAVVFNGGLLTAKDRVLTYKYYGTKWAEPLQFAGPIPEPTDQPVG